MHGTNPALLILLLAAAATLGRVGSTAAQKATTRRAAIRRWLSSYASHANITKIGQCHAGRYAAAATAADPNLCWLL